MRDHETDALVAGLRELFLTADGSNSNILVKLTEYAVAVALRHQGDGPYYSGNTESSASACDQTYQLSAEGCTPTEALDQLPSLLRDCVKPHHPLLAKNIIPLPSFIYMAAYSATSLFMGNGVTGEDAASALTAETMCSRALADLVGYNAREAAGLFTFGGTGTNLYAFKMGLTKADPEHPTRGIRTQGVFIGSWPAHYSHRTAATWLGVGRDNYLAVPSHLDQSTNLTALEETCRRSVDAGLRIYGIAGVAGTTSNMAVDDFAAISEIRDRIVADYGLDYTPHIHGDAVVGWAYLTFLSYDLSSNPLRLTAPVIRKVTRLIRRLQTLRHADSIGVDFHKTGFSPYTSSMVIVKNRRDFGLLRRDNKDMAPLFHDPASYNPGAYSLETSRSTANMIATWLTLKTLGQVGLQRLLAHALENANQIRARLQASRCLGVVVVNRESYGPDVFVRLYPHGKPVPSLDEELSTDWRIEEGNKYNSAFFAWLTSQETPANRGFAVSKTSAAFYSFSGKPVVAIRVYSLNPNMTRQHARDIADLLIEAKESYDQDGRLDR